MLMRKPRYLDMCSSELWEGVRCTLPKGHQGSHQRPATESTCAISWRASAFPPPVPEKPKSGPLRLSTVVR
jgi:hypothetical protein